MAKTKNAKPTPAKKGDGRKKQSIDAPRGSSTFKLNPFDIVILGVDTSDPPESSDLSMLLRKHRIQRPLEQDLLESIRTNGVEHAITTAKVWLPKGMTLHGKVLKAEEQHVIAIDGRRRTLHTRKLCEEAGDKDGKKGSYVIKAWPPKTSMNIQELAGLAVELDETSRHDDVLEKAEQARIMFARTNDKAWVAKKFNVDPQTIDGWFKLRAEAAPAVIDAVRVKRGGINATSATKLTRLPPSKQVEVMEEAIASGKTSAKQIDGLVRKAVAESKGVKPSERPNGAPPKRQLVAAVQVIEDSELDIPDEFVTREKAYVEILKWAHDGIISNKAIGELAKKSAERMKGNRTDGDTRQESDKAEVAAKE